MMYHLSTPPALPSHAHFGAAEQGCTGVGVGTYMNLRSFPLPLYLGRTPSGHLSSPLCQISLVGGIRHFLLQRRRQVAGDTVNCPLAVASEMLSLPLSSNPDPPVLHKDCCNFISCHELLYHQASKAGTARDSWPLFPTLQSRRELSCC